MDTEKANMVRAHIEACTAATLLPDYLMEEALEVSKGKKSSVLEEMTLFTMYSSILIYRYMPQIRRIFPLEMSQRLGMLEEFKLSMQHMQETKLLKRRQRTDDTISDLI